MKGLLLLFLISVPCCARAQNIEGQIVASQFGEFKVQNEGNGFAFDPANCNVSGGGKNFPAFVTGTPVKIVDSNPAQIEIVVPVSASITGSYCTVSLATQYSHSSFYLTSGTGGLQEAITANQTNNGINSIILNWEWYRLVAPGNPASVIASVTGIPSLGLVDVTTTPYSYYVWNGTQYVSVGSGGGGSIPTTPLVLKGNNAGAAAPAVPGTDYVLPSGNITGSAGSVAFTGLTGTPTIWNQNTTGTAAGLSAASALPNNTTAATQTVGDASTKVATDAFVLANAGGTIPATSLVLKGSGTAGSSVAATANTDYLTPSYWSSLTNCTVAGYSWSPAAGACIAGGGASTPATTNLLKGNGAANSVVAASPGNDFITPNASNGMTSTGIATSGQNYNSNQFQFQGNYWNGTAAASDYWGFVDNVGSGSNPNASFTVTHSGTSGVATFGFAMPVVGVTAPAGDNSTKFATTASVFSSLPSVPAQFFGAYGDAYGPPDGCTTTASSTTVVCPDSTFVPTDVGKQFWEHGAGAGGVAFNATITSFIDAAHVVVSAAPSISVSNAPGNAVYGHDDTAGVQACWQYSATQGVQCTLRALPLPYGGLGFTGFLIGSAGLQLVSSNGDTESSATSTTGSSSINGTNLFCEYNGDCVSLAAGPIQGAVFSNINLEGDPTQPNGRGFHFKATAGTYGNGGLWNATFTNFQTSNFSLECMLSEGGNYTSGGELPNQVDTFINFMCNAPNKMHTANLIKMTGQHAQILFMNGQVNGPGTEANQPNAMILITEQTTGQADAATDVKFYGYTYEVGTIGLQLGNGAYNIHYDNGYVENVAEPLIAGGNPSYGGVFGMTYNGNHIANSGNTIAVAQFTGGVTGSFRDGLIFGGVYPAAIAVCTGTSSGGVDSNSVDFVNNESTSGVTATTGCATTTAAPSGATLAVSGGTSVSVSADSTPITTITAPVIGSGKTLTLYASGTFSLATGGNINLGGFGSPLTISSGNSVTLTLLDQTATWLVTAMTPSSGGPAPIVASSETVASSATPTFSTAVNTSYMVLTANVTTFTLGAGSDGQHKTICLKQGSGPYTVTPPANVHGFMTVGTTNGAYNCQSLVMNLANSIWLADSPGVVNE